MKKNLMMLALIILSAVLVGNPVLAVGGVKLKPPKGIFALPEKERTQKIYANKKNNKKRYFRLLEEYIQENEGMEPFKEGQYVNVFHSEHCWKIDHEGTLAGIIYHGYGCPALPHLFLTTDYSGAGKKFIYITHADAIYLTFLRRENISHPNRTWYMLSDILINLAKHYDWLTGYLLTKYEATRYVYNVPLSDRELISRGSPKKQMEKAEEYLKDAVKRLNQLKKDKNHGVHLVKLVDEFDEFFKKKYLLVKKKVTLCCIYK